MSFHQDPPREPDPWLADPALRAQVRRRLSPELFDEVEPRLAELGAAAAELAALADAAEAEPPVHVPFDAWGRRVDDLRTSAAWRELRAFSARRGLVAAGYDEGLGDRARIVQAALLHLYSARSATYSCPLAMTDAAARVLIDSAPGPLRDRLVPGLLAREPERFLTSGQWMTERTGGSDVGGTSTIARHVAGDTYELFGLKWFTSATDAEMALTLARVEGDDGAGSRGLTLFCVEVGRDEHGALRGLRLERLKDKLGTRALPTAELTLDGVRATRIGERGRGVAGIAPMLNVTRWYNGVAAASGMARAWLLARDYAARRTAFGRPIAEQPLHRRTLEEIEAESAGATAFAIEVADLIGRVERGAADEGERVRLRALVPLLKLTTGKQAVAVASEALECFGGAGYVEDTGLPRLLRDAQVLSIWEGTTNVLALDLLRAERKGGALSAVVEDLRGRARKVSDVDPRVEENLGRIASALPGCVEERGEAGARRLALATGYAVEAVLLGEAALADRTEASSRARLALFLQGRLSGPLS